MADLRPTQAMTALPVRSAGLSVNPPSKPDAQKLREAAQGFEAFFLSTFLQAAHGATEGDDLTGSNAVSSAQDMLNTQLADSGSQHSNLGIADAVVRQFSQGVRSYRPNGLHDSGTVLAETKEYPLHKG